MHQATAARNPALPQPGDRAPGFSARNALNPQFRFDSVGGRWIVLGFVGTAGAEPLAARVRAVMQATDLFDDTMAALFLISCDPADELTGRMADALPGRRVFHDHDQAVSRLYGASPPQGEDGPYMPFWVVIDPSLTVRRVIPFSQDGGDVPELLAHLRRQPPAERFLGFEGPVPILILPDVFEPAFCDFLVQLYENDGGSVSGFMRDEGGKTVAVQDTSFKVRRDFTLSDPAHIQAVQARILRKVVPQIERVHFFRATRMERYMVGCYDAGEGGHFRPHRDNTTIGTAHRRYAVSINLNEDFDGGEVSFPEYALRGFKGPKGSAVIFSCSMLHAVSRVTRGRRYAFLPFLYDEAAAKLREQNASLVPNSEGYKA